MKLTDLTTESQFDPIGLDEPNPRFCWKICSERSNVMQDSYRIVVKTDGGAVWDSGTVPDGRSIFVPYAGSPLAPFTRYEWRVTATDCTGETASASASFETGRMDTPWRAKWIAADGPLDDDAVTPTYLFFKRVPVRKAPVRARIFVTALGCYALSVGGVRVGEDYFTPGYTDYLRHVPYQTYDVTGLIRQGENELRCELAGGWYTGRLGLSIKGNRYGKKRALLLELRLDYADGTTETICSDQSFRYTADGPRRFAGFFDGETYDATREDESLWTFRPARLLRGRKPAITAELGCRTIRHARIEPLETRPVEDGIIFDFGRNFAGFVRISVDAPKDAEISVLHAEILGNDGDLYTENLRTAKARLCYVSKGGLQTYEPLFTYMGFRYAKLQGVTQEQVKAVCAFELYANTPLTGTFSCDNERINQLQRNIVTTQKANFIDIPTDCPQRDERIGWTGDLAMYSATANFNMAAGRFLRKWLCDLRSEQERALGNVPYIVPLGGVKWMRIMPSPIWGDACAIVPWDAFMASGDIRFLEESYGSIKKWLRYMSVITALLHPPFSKKRFLYRGFSWGDWVAPGTTMKEQIKRAEWLSAEYMAHSAKLLADIADILGREAEAEEHRALEARIKKSFCDTYLDEGGHIRGGFQSAYAAALRYDILPKAAAAVAADDLEQDVIARDYHLSTGFPGTLHLPFALLDSGRNDTAFRLLLQDTCPSWLYPIRCGATSIWERWDALREDGSVNEDPVGKSNMVSFSHYAYGAVGQFLYERIGGITANQAGYRKFTVRPHIGGGIWRAQVALETPFGRISSVWSLQDDGTFSLEIQAPPNTQATVCMPSGEEHEIGSGRYTFTSRIDETAVLDRNHIRRT